MRKAIRIIDVRDEARGGPHGAGALQSFTGELGVALVTAGPGNDQCHYRHRQRPCVARFPVLGDLRLAIPRPQENRGGPAGYGSHAAGTFSITRYARTVREPSLVLQELDEAISRALR